MIAGLVGQPGREPQLRERLAELTAERRQQTEPEGQIDQLQPSALRRRTGFGEQLLRLVDLALHLRQAPSGLGQRPRPDAGIRIRPRHFRAPQAAVQRALLVLLEIVRVADLMQRVSGHVRQAPRFCLQHQLAQIAGDFFESLGPAIGQHAHLEQVQLCAQAFGTGQRADQRQRLLRDRERLLAGEDPHRLLRGLHRSAHRERVLAAEERLTCHLSRQCRVARFPQRPRQRGVQQLAPRRRHPPQRCFAHEIVGEVDPGARVETRQPAALEREEGLHHFGLGAARHPREQRRGHRAAQRRRPGEERLRRFVERLDALLQRLQQPAAEQRPSLGEGKAHLQREQRIARALRMHLPGVGGQPAGAQELGDGARVERPQRQLGQRALPPQHAQEAQDGGVVGQLAFAGRQHEAHSGRGAREVVRQRGRRLVHPLHVVEQEQRRAALAEQRRDRVEEPGAIETLRRRRQLGKQRTQVATERVARLGRDARRAQRLDDAAVRPRLFGLVAAAGEDRARG